MPTLLQELTASGLILWRLRYTPASQLWCVAADFAGELGLTIYDQASDAAPLTEIHPTIASLVDRAESLHNQFVAAGWESVDVDLDEPD